MKKLAEDHEADMKAYDDQLIKIRDELTTKDQTVTSTKLKLKQKEE